MEGLAKDFSLAIVQSNSEAITRLTRRVIERTGTLEITEEHAALITTALMTDKAALKLEALCKSHRAVCAVTLHLMREIQERAPESAAK